jgi:RNA polymerase sigma factor (sigma-70 family)
MRLTALGDERLARLVAGANERAFATLYERYHQTLYRYCRSIVGSDADAQDVLQSTFAAAFTALQRGQRNAPLRPWLFRIAHNEAVSLIRRRRPEDELSQASACTIASVEEQAGERARFALLLSDLHQLPERQRGALVMRELSGLSHEEIAIALGTSVGAAKQTIFEARRSLSEFAEGREMACDDVRRAVSDADKRVLRARRVRAHLRACSGCAAFAAAIPARSSDLRALAPALPAVSAATVLGRVAGSGSGHGGSGGLAVGAAGKTVSVAVAAKAVAGAVIVATATLSVATAIKPHARATDHSAATHAAAARHGGGTAPEANRGAAVVAHHASAGGAARVSAHRPRAAALTRASASASAKGAARHGSAVTSSGVAHAGGPAAAPVLGGGSQGVTDTASGRGGSPGAHPNGAPGSVRGAGRPTTSGSGRPATAGSGRPATAGSGRPATAGSGRPATSSSGRPAAVGSGRPTTPSSARPTTPTTAPPTTPGSGQPTAPTTPGSGRPSTPSGAPGSERPSTPAGGAAGTAGSTASGH